MNRTSRKLLSAATIAAVAATGIGMQACEDDDDEIKVNRSDLSIYAPVTRITNEDDPRESTTINYKGLFVTVREYEGASYRDLAGYSLRNEPEWDYSFGSGDLDYPNAELTYYCNNHGLVEEIDATAEDEEDDYVEKFEYSRRGELTYSEKKSDDIEETVHYDWSDGLLRSISKKRDDGHKKTTENITFEYGDIPNGAGLYFDQAGYLSAKHMTTHLGRTPRYLPSGARYSRSEKSGKLNISNPEAPLEYSYEMEDGIPTRVIITTATMEESFLLDY